MPETTKAKRGDLVALVIERSSVHTEGRKVRLDVEVELVTSITREGAVKATTSLHYTDSKPTPVERRLGLVERRVIPATWLVDFDGAVAAVKANTYPNSTTPKGFDSLDECRDALRPFLKVRAA